MDRLDRLRQTLRLLKEQRDIYPPGEVPVSILNKILDVEAQIKEEIASGEEELTPERGAEVDLIAQTMKMLQDQLRDTAQNISDLREQVGQLRSDLIVLSSSVENMRRDISNIQETLDTMDGAKMVQRLQWIIIILSIAVAVEILIIVGVR